MNANGGRRRSAAVQRDGRDPVPGTGKSDVADVATWPVLECFLSPDWRDVRTPKHVCVARRDPDSGRVGIGLLLVDLGCLGWRKGHWFLSPSVDTYQSLLRPALVAGIAVEPCDPALAAKVVHEAERYAHGLGFQPPRAAREAGRLFAGLAPDACALAVPLGENGKPVCMPGPDDDVELIARKLERRLGRAGFVLEADDNAFDVELVDGFLPEEGLHLGGGDVEDAEA